MCIVEKVGQVIIFIQRIEVKLQLIQDDFDQILPVLVISFLWSMEPMPEYQPIELYNVSYLKRIMLPKQV